jgi:hypothetical protein
LLCPNCVGPISIIMLLVVSTLFAALSTGAFAQKVHNERPVAHDQALSVDEDTPLEITLTASDEDGDELSYSVVDNPTHGTLSGTAPDLTYTPDANYNGQDSFTFKANDGSADSDRRGADSKKAKISITVNAINDHPTANSQSFTTDEDTPVTITLTGNDIDQGSSLIFAVTANPTHGTLSGTAPDLTYTPDANYNGQDSFTFKANDGSADSDTATVSITIDATNSSPTVDAGPDQTVSVNSAVTLDGTASDDDIDLIVLWTQISGPSVELSDPSIADPTFTAPAATAILEFQLTATDGDDVQASDTIIISVSNVNQPPVADAGPDQTVDERETVTLNGGASSDSDGTISSFSWSQTNGPTVTLSDTTIDSPTFVAPNVNADVTIAFTLVVTDNDGESDSDVVTINVENRRSGGGGGGGGGGGVIADTTGPTVTASPPAGTYATTLLVTLSSSETGATIRYTTSGTDPTASSPQYNGSISISADTTLKFFGTDSSRNAGSVVTAVYDINIIHMRDIETNGTGWGIYSTRPLLSEYVSNSSVLVGKYIDTITVNLRKSPGATGAAQIGIINPDLSMKKVFATLDISTLSETRYIPNKFNLTGEIYLIQAGDRIGVKHTGGTSNSSYISIMRDTNTADPFDGANTYLSYYTTSWNNQTTFDLVMSLEYSTKSLPVFSASYFLVNPLTKILVLGSSFFNTERTSILQGAVGEQMQLSSILQNQQQTSQTCTYIVQVSDETGVVVDFSAQTGVIEAGQFMTVEKSWQPLVAGTYTIKVFVWDDTSEITESLSSISERTILVV